MASTSSASVQKSFKYDVFLSFRGEDTRKNFVDHLYLALVNRGIITYKDDETIEKGERISDQLLRSIEDSRFYIIVFSKNYASSSWCLDELVKIIECQKTSEHTAYPIFYDVEPTEVRNQSGPVGEAFAKHVKGSWSSVLSIFSIIFFYCRILLQRIFFFIDWFTRVADPENEDDVGRWRNALKEAAALAGMELKNSFNGHEAKFIQKIIEEVSLKLHFINSGFDEKLVGMEIRVKDVLSSLEIGSEDVRMIGIKGMGGGGKTTLARVVFDHISISFEARSFVANVREGSKDLGLKELQKQVLQDLLNDQNTNVANVYDREDKMKKIMGSRKVLVVLDDVDDIEQLEALAGGRNWFKPGSRIIITTRDEQVLVAQRVNSIHDVNLLSNEEAICLFSKYAFGKEIPDQGYEELSEKVVHYAAGLPLTLKVLGSHLCGRNEDEWVDAIERLKTIPLEKTLKRLELSYDGLENDQKEIFLDVVCMLKGEPKVYAIRTLESCGFNAQIGLSVLEQKSLITISNTDVLCFHDHIEEMGWNIVRRLHPHEPNRHSHLWINVETQDILDNELGTEETKYIKLKCTCLPASIMKGLRNMRELRFLHVENDFGMVGGVCDQYLPDSLQTLYWKSYPFCYLPKTFQANKLVNLELPFSSMSQLCEAGGRKVLEKLKFLDLCYSKVTNLNLRMTPNLEKLNLYKCYNFKELQLPVECPKLKLLNLSYSKVSNLNLGMTPHLEMLHLEGCNNIVELQVKCPKLKFLNLSNSKVSNLNLRMTPHLEELDLGGCYKFEELHLPVECRKLKFLDLSDSRVSNLNLRMTPHLEKLNLQGCEEFVELNFPIKCLYLRVLNLCGSMLRNLNLGIFPHLEELKLKGCNEFVYLHLPVQCPKLKFLNLSDSMVSNLNLGMTPHLEKLNLEGCDEFVELHLPVECPNLKILNVCGSKLRNLNLGMTPHLEELYLKGCNEFVELHLPVECPNLRIINLHGSKLRNLNLGMTPHLEQLNLEGCNEFVELHLPVVCPKLKFLNLSGSKLGKLNLGMTPHLEELYLEACNEFVELHLPVECPKLTSLDIKDSKVSNLNLGMTPHLDVLDLKGCYYLQEVHAPMGCLENILYLDLSGCLRFEKFMVGVQYTLPGPSFAKLKLTAKSLDICPLHPNSNFPKFQFKCDYDECLPPSTGNFEKLISFGLCACTDLESFSTTICSLQYLEVLTLEGSIPEVPKDLWQLESLEKLTLMMKEIKHLPDSICMMKHLKYLNLESCSLLEELPKDLGRLESLEELDLTYCRSLRDIPSSICDMECLKRLLLIYCIRVEQLPEKLGRLECLKELNIQGAGISSLPQSIYQSRGLHMIGSRWQLESYGFTSLTEISRGASTCVVLL